jgi:hypothetical protein
VIVIDMPGGILLRKRTVIDDLFGSMKGANPEHYRDRDDRY